MVFCGEVPLLEEWKPTYAMFEKQKQKKKKLVHTKVECEEGRGEPHSHKRRVVFTLLVSIFSVSREDAIGLRVSDTEKKRRSGKTDQGA